MFFPGRRDNSRPLMDYPPYMQTNHALPYLQHDTQCKPCTYLGLANFRSFVFRFGYFQEVSVLVALCFSLATFRSFVF